MNNIYFVLGLCIKTHINARTLERNGHCFVSSVAADVEKSEGSTERESSSYNCEQDNIITELLDALYRSHVVQNTCQIFKTVSL